MANYFETGEFPLLLNDVGIRRGRSIRDGYARGWGLEYGGISDEVRADPIYQEAVSLSSGRSIQTEACRLNLFLLAKYFLPALLENAGSGSIFEFGSFRGGSAIFLAAVCRRVAPAVRVYGLDTFGGMPSTDKNVDAHNAGDFSNVDLDELRSYVEQCGLSDRLEFVKGTFEDTAVAKLASAAPVLLAHIDCDIHRSVAFAWEAVKPRMTPGGYIVFDDAHTSSCLGATEVVEDLVIRRDGLNCEQIWPHFVFRVWPELRGQYPQLDHAPEAHILEDLSRLAELEAQLQTARQRISSVIGEASAEMPDVAALVKRLEEMEFALMSLRGEYQTLKKQVAMAQTSRWLQLGRKLGVGPQFDISSK